jgi:hypothetical protein
MLILGGSAIDTKGSLRAQETSATRPLVFIELMVQVTQGK